MKTLAGEAVCANDCGAPDGHSSANALAVALTLSLKLMTMAESTGTFDAPFAGVVAPTAGARVARRTCCRHREIVDRQAVIAPLSSGSCHRSQISCPLATVTASVAEIAIRLAGALPSSVAADAPVTGPVKLSAGTVVQPVAGVLAPVMTPEVGDLILEGERVGGGVAAIPPLLAHVADVERRDRSARVVRQPRRLEDRPGASRPDRAQRTSVAGLVPATPKL